MILVARAMSTGNARTWLKRLCMKDIGRSLGGMGCCFVIRSERRKRGGRKVILVQKLWRCITVLVMQRV